MKIDLVLFDLDDTLMAFDLISIEAWNKAIDIFIHENNIKTDKSFLLDKIIKTKSWYWSDPERHRIGRKNLAHTRREVVKLALKDFLNVDDEKLERLGDNLVWDIGPPQKLGIYSVWINTKNLKPQDYDIKPDRTIQKISEILEIL